MTRRFRRLTLPGPTVLAVNHGSRVTLLRHPQKWGFLPFFVDCLSTQYLDYITSNGMIILYNKLERIWKEAVEA
jgi:hypothetical protein